MSRTDDRPPPSPSRLLLQRVPAAIWYTQNLPIAASSPLKNRNRSHITTTYLRPGDSCWTCRRVRQCNSSPPTVPNQDDISDNDPYNKMGARSGKSLHGMRSHQRVLRTICWPVYFNHHAKPRWERKMFRVSNTHHSRELLRKCTAAERSRNVSITILIARFLCTVSSKFPFRPDETSNGFSSSLKKWEEKQNCWEEGAFRCFALWLDCLRNKWYAGVLNLPRSLLLGSSKFL